MSEAGIRLAHKKSLKTTYKHLGPQEKRLIKIDERLEQINKYIEYCYGIHPRLESGAVDWNAWEKNSHAETYFDFERERDSLNGSRDRLIEKHGLDEKTIYSFHMASQFHYSQSF